MKVAGILEAFASSVVALYSLVATRGSIDLVSAAQPARIAVTATISSEISS